MKCKVQEYVTERVFADLKLIADADLPWEQLQDKTVLITGAGGFIASYLIQSMLIQNDEHQRNITVLGMARSLERTRKKYGDLLEREDFRLVVQDVCEPFTIKEKADYVIHAASNASAWHFEHVPVDTIRANLVGTENVLRYAKECGDCTVLFVSSLKVYGKVTDGSKKLTEDTIGYVDHTDYHNCYAVGKRAAETLCASYYKQYGMDIKIARPSYIYGPAGIDDDRVWAQFIANVVRGENILLKSNGGAYRSFCYVTDTASALLTILLKGEPVTPYNIAGEISDVTIRDFAKSAVNAFPERHLTLAFANPEDEKEPVIDYSKQTPEIMDETRINGLGWSAKIGITEGIRRAVGIVEEREKKNNEK